MKNETKPTLELSKLVEGEHKFKVTVTGANRTWKGLKVRRECEAVGIVTVFPGNKIYEN